MAAASALLAWIAPTVLLDILPGSVTASVQSAGGSEALHVAVVGFAIVPLGMLCSQYLFFLNRPAAPLAGIVGGGVVTIASSSLLVAGGDLAAVAWGLVAGAAVYTGVTLIASFRALAAGEESFYASF